MKYTKIVLAWLLALACAVSFVACSGEGSGEGDTYETKGATEGTAPEETEQESPQLQYNTDGGLCEIVGVTDKTKTTYEIPDFVTGIGSRAFEGCTNLTSITIPVGVTSIGAEAFKGCAALTSVTFEKTIGWSAGEVSVSSKDLSDRETSATCLTDTYCDVAWSHEGDWSPWY